MSVNLLIEPSRPADQPPKRRLMHCPTCGANAYPALRKVKTTGGETGWIWFAECFNCHCVLLAEFKRGGQDGEEEAGPEAEAEEKHADDAGNDQKDAHDEEGRHGQDAG